MSTYNLDYINSGKVLFDLYKETGKEKYKAAMDLLVEQLKRQPRTLEGGFWHKLIYQHQMWLDGLYMASPFLARYGAEFNRPDLIDEAVKQFTLCHKHTYSPETGLYHHAWDESKSNVGQIRKTVLHLILGTQYRLVVHGHGRCTGLYSRQPPRTCLAYQLDSRFGRKPAQLSKRRSMVSGNRPARA